jgi:glycosyltransferase involved in cell wall biosynthesis
VVKAKGASDLLEAYAQLDPEMRRQIGLVFVGDGAEFAKMREAAARIAPGTVQFPGFVHREELPEYYALADAFIFPTHSDTWGLVVNEALACSLPVIISKVAGCAEDLVQDGWNGFVLPPSDPAQLAMAMARLAGDSKLRLTMASNSKEKIAAYSPEAWAEGAVRAAQFVCAKKKPAMTGRV